MLSIVACAACGMDPASDTMLVQAAIAGVMSLPWIFRGHAYKVMRRVRGKPEPAEESCPLPADDDEA
jgi:hypothetical protein